MDFRTMDVSVILPIHNEIENLEPLLDEIDEALGSQKLVYEIVAVDDGSPGAGSCAAGRGSSC